ncbi:MAG: hypothetical protein RDU30_00935 [Desulfovibrionaceae bacterium]|nr:hypothetical protein [Desulfovibrionaceae bacterium]
MASLERRIQILEKVEATVPQSPVMFLWDTSGHESRPVTGIAPQGHGETTHRQSGETEDELVERFSKTLPPRMRFCLANILREG